MNRPEQDQIKKWEEILRADCVGHIRRLLFVPTLSPDIYETRSKELDKIYAAMGVNDDSMELASEYVAGVILGYDRAVCVLSQEVFTRGYEFGCNLRLEAIEYLN